MLVTVNDPVQLEQRHPNGTVTEVTCTAEEFAKVVKPEVVAGAAGLRDDVPVSVTTGAGARHAPVLLADFTSRGEGSPSVYIRTYKAAA